MAFGSSLTKLAALPIGAVRSLEDPFGDKKSRWAKIVVLVCILIVLLYILNQQGVINKWISVIVGK